MSGAIIFCLVMITLLACGNPTAGETPPGDREDAVPEDAVKVTPDTDLYPPVLHSTEWAAPVPLNGPVNTAGVEDAPVVSDDGNTLYFFFTPDASVPAEDQLTDGFTGIWKCQLEGGTWSEPERVLLCESVSLDGPMDLHGDTLWFASIREDMWTDDGDIYLGVQEGQSWSWWNAGQQLNATYNIGEVTVSPGADTLIYARSSQYGEYGGYDLWRSAKEGAEWSAPENLGPVVNSIWDDGWPCLSHDGTELWITRTVSAQGYPGPALFRSIWNGDVWSEPQEIVSSFVGDAAVDGQGNLYFTHVFADSSGEIIETDIYFAARI